MIKKYKNGDMVVILSKSHWGPLNSSNVYKRGKEQGYWYFQYYHDEYEKELCIVDSKLNTKSGDYFYESDLMPYYTDFLSDEDFKL